MRNTEVLSTTTAPAATGGEQCDVDVFERISLEYLDRQLAVLKRQELADGSL
jgi:hypothetical protein